MPLPPLSEFDGASCAVHITRAEAYRARVATLALRFRALARQPQEAQS